MAMASWIAAVRRAWPALALLAGLALGPSAGLGQETKKTGLLGPWNATAEISYVVTGGNTSTSAFSLGTSLSRKWAKDSLLFKGYILNSRSTTTTRTAQGTETDFVIIEDRVSRQVAENYLLAGQYDRRISKILTGQAGLSWDRNRFAGVDERVMVTTGFGLVWVDKARTQVKTSAGMTYTVEAVRRGGHGVVRRLPLHRPRRPEDLRKLVRFDPVRLRR